MGSMINEDRFGVVTLVIDPASVATITTAEQTFALPGLRVGDFVAVNKPSNTVGLGVVNVRVSAKDTLGITFVNPTVAGVDAASETWTIFWFRGEKITTGVVNV